MKRNIAAAVTGFALLILLLGGAQRLLMPKYQEGVVEGSMIAEYYNDPSPHDVLFIGDCELYENLSPIALWRMYGIPSYIRGSAQQLNWQTYALLEDALQRETPQVVVVNVLACKYNAPQSEAYNRMSIDGMRWGLPKLRAIFSSMMPDEHAIEYLFPLLRYHDRWSQLEEQDLTHFLTRDSVTHNGYYMRADVRPQGAFPPVMPLAQYTLGEKAMGYLQRIADLCRQKGVQLLLMKAPTEYPHWYDQWEEQICAFAEKNDLLYVNCIPLQEEIGLDLQVDTYDGGLHLNIQGAEKLTRYLGRILVREYNLSDRRDDPELSALWEEKCARYDAEHARQLQEIAQYGMLLSHQGSEKQP